MEVYRKQTQKIVKNFLGRKIGFAECIAALNHALASFIGRGGSEELLAIRAVMMNNNETVMKEMAKREGQRKAQAKFKGKKS